MIKRILALFTAITVLLCAQAALYSCKGPNTQTDEEITETDEAEKEKMDLSGITPEKMGISSENITKLLEGLKKEGLAMHSVLIMRHGEIVSEAYAEPFDANSLHRMYSVSKSFVSIAIGVLEAEGKISINDTIDNYFPEHVNESTDQRIAKTKIVDLLRMASPFKKGSTYDGKKDMNWVETFFTAKATKDPGTEYYYDTSATYILGVIVERVTGMDFLEYLKEEALHEIGFSEDSWCIKSPEGYAWGGSGVMCTSRDLAAFANLVMNEGEYNGKQLLPADYIKAATTKQMDTSIEGNSDYWGKGYGYQIWINPYGFAFMGMGNQHAYCIPELDLVFVCTADNQENEDKADGVIYSLMEQYIIKGISDEPLPEDPEAFAILTQAIKAMALPYQTGDLTSKKIDSINGNTYTASSSDKISWFRLDFDGDEGTFTYNTPRGEKQLCFGIGKNVECILDEPQYSGESINHPNTKGYLAYCSGAWKSRNIFILKVQVVDDYLGNMTLVFNFTSTPTLTVTKTAEWFLDEYKMDSVKYTKQ